MRPIARRVTLGPVAVLLLLLALGAVPGYFESGDPYRLTATPVDGNATGEAVHVTHNGTVYRLEVTQESDE